MNNLDPRTIKKILIGILLLFVVGFLVWGIVYLFTHGRIKVEGDNISRVTIVKVNTDRTEKQEVSGTSATVSSGDYAVQVETEGKQLYSANVSVKNFLRTTTLSPEFASQSQTRKIAINTKQYIVPTSGGRSFSFGTHNNDQSVIMHANNDPFGERSRRVDYAFGHVGFYSKQLYDKQVIGLHVVDFDHDEILLEPAVFDPSSQRIRSMPYPEGELDYIENPRILASNNQADKYFVVLPGRESGTIYAYSSPRQSPSEINLQEAPAHADDDPLVSVSGEYMAVLSGSGYESPRIDDDHDDDDHDEQSEEQVRHTLYIFDLGTGQQIKRVDLDSALLPVDIKLSPNGTYLAVAGETRTTVFSLADREAETVFVSPFEFTGKMLWQDDSRLLYSTPEGGLYSLDMGSRESVAVFWNESVGINNFYLDGETVYMAAFTGLDSENNAAPDGYAIDLTASDPNNNSVFNHLPHATDEFQVNLIGDRITIRPRVIIGSLGVGAAEQSEINAKADTARRYLTENIPNLDDFTISVSKP